MYASVSQSNCAQYRRCPPPKLVPFARVCDVFTYSAYRASWSIGCPSRHPIACNDRVESIWITSFDIHYYYWLLRNLCSRAVGNHSLRWINDKVGSGLSNQWNISEYFPRAFAAEFKNSKLFSQEFLVFACVPHCKKVLYVYVLYVYYILYEIICDFKSRGMLTKRCV